MRSILLKLLALMALFWSGMVMAAEPIKVGALVAATGPASCTSSSQACPSAFPDQVALELRQRSEDMKDQLPSCARCLDLLGDALEADSLFFQLGDDVHEVGQTAAKPIQPPHNKRVARSDLVQQFVQLGPSCQRSRDDIDEDPVTACRLQRVDLEGCILVRGGHACVSEKMSHELTVAELIAH